MIVDARNLVKRYKELIALDHFNLQVEKKDMLGLLGPNGSGKTTAINCILSLLQYDKGEIYLFGEKMSPTRYDIKKRIGVVPQNLAYFENLNVEENIDYFTGLYIDNKNERKKLVEEALDFVDLQKYRKFIPKKLSGGLKRRLNIACGIAHKPELIFMDEPTVAVDAQSRNFILDGVRRLNEQGSTIVYTTHYIEEIDGLCNKITIIDKGRNIAEGSSDELKSMISSTEKINVTFLEPLDLTESLKDIKHVLQVERQGDQYEIQFEKGSNNLVHLIEFMREKQLNYTDVYSQKPTLSDVFLELTGKELRNE